MRLINIREKLIVSLGMGMTHSIPIVSNNTSPLTFGLYDIFKREYRIMSETLDEYNAIY